ncbi:FtsL-like putative cell division protein [Bacteroidota bacterium]
MVKNTYKIRNEASGKESMFSWFQQVLNLDKKLDDGLPVRYLPQILFVTFLTIFYIGNNHYAEKTIRKIEKLELEVEESRADYTSLKADYMFASKQSEVATKVKELGLKENKMPPYKIIVQEGEY